MQDDVKTPPAQFDTATVRLALALGVAMIISKLPFVLTTIGEQDQARMILSAMVYAQDGPLTLRPYFLFTSPLWVVPFSWLSALLNASTLLQLSNVIGWLAGGATSTLAFLLLRRLGASMSWAAVGAIAVAWVPGAFYSSLYGYPSQFALPFLLASALAFLVCLETQQQHRLRWFLAASVSFAVLVFLKVDFALAGTLMLSMAILRRQIFSRWTLSLPAMVAGIAVLFWVLTRILVRQPYSEFARGWNEFHPGRPDTLFADHSITVAYGCGWATLTLFALLFLARLFRRQHTAAALREVLAWAVATLPLWVFWLLHPPMSTRHALPGILVTTLFATLAASRLFAKPVWLAPVWLLLLLGGNGLFGVPGFDINYNPSGRLFPALRVNQHAYAVATEIAEVITRRPENVKVVFGELQPQVLGGLDFHPMIEYAMACTAKTARCTSHYGMPKSGHWMDLVFTHADGHETKLFRVTDFRRQRAYQAENTGLYAPWGTGSEKMSVPVMSFDPNALYQQIRQ